MAASKLNYIVVYKNHSQVYGCSSKKIALESPPPEGYTNDDKRILFATFEPDTSSLCVYPVSLDDESIEEVKVKKVNIKLLPGQTYIILNAEQMFQISTALIHVSASMKNEKERLDLLKISEEATKAITENQYTGDIYDEEENWT